MRIVMPASPGFVKVKFFDFILKFLWFNVLVTERVNREDRVLRLYSVCFSLVVTLWAATPPEGRE